MKKLSIVLSIILLILGITACSSGGGDPVNSNKYTLDIQKDGQGSIIKPDGVGKYEFDKDTVVEIVVEPNKGYVFDGWEGSDGEDVVKGEKTNSWKINMNKDKEIVAIFNKLNTAVKIEKMPESVTGHESNSSQSLANSINIASNSKYDEWGSFEVVPQIGVNYNSWVDRHESLFNQLIKISPDATEITDNYTGRKYKMQYKELTNSLYDVKIRLLDPETENLVKIFYYNNEKNKIQFFEIRDGGEIRQLLHKEFGDTIVELALFYRKNVDNMNDIVEVRKTNNMVKTKCQRVYHINTSEEFTLNFASVTDIATQNENSTGYIKYDGYRRESPAIFDNNDFLIQTNVEKIPENFPNKSSVLELYDVGVTLDIVRDARIEESTIESNLSEITNFFDYEY